MLGNFLVQLLACGEIKTLDEARSVARASTSLTTHEPDGSSIWQEGRERFAEIVKATNERHGSGPKTLSYAPQKFPRD